MGWRAADCHPEKKHSAKGLCDTCYRRERSRKYGVKPRREQIPPECHPSSKYYAAGLCKKCYQKSKYYSYGKERLDKNPNLKLKYRVNKHNISITEYQKLLNSQIGKCAICLSYMESPEIDHDHSCCNGPHSCGKCIRGLLCGKCNRLLMYSNDDSAILLNALTYLQRWRNR